MNPEVFREYDIRGIADVELLPPDAVRLGKAVGTYFVREECRKIVIGRDVRLSSNRLRDNLVAGLNHSGIDVIDVGLCPTPVLYFALYQLDPDGGVMITGSHNPPEYNGLKVAVGKAPIYGAQIQKIADILYAGSFEEGDGTWSKLETSILDDYIQDFVGGIGRLSKRLRVVVDCGNGAASLAAVGVYQALGCEVLPLYCEADGHFPNHHPDPTIAANLESLSVQVREENADLGLAFDGDGDRLGVVDDEGKIIWGDELMIIFSRSVLEQHPGATVVADVKCSKTLFEEIEKRGGRAVIWKSGHSLTRAKMVQEGALLAGELSGHIFFRDRHRGYDDGLYAGARLLEICALSGTKLSTMRKELPRTFRTPEMRRPCSDQQKFEIERRAKAYFASSFPVIEIDGVRVIFDDGWGLLRASNTEPAVVLRFEADSESRLQEIERLFQEKLDQIMSEISVGD